MPAKYKYVKRKGHPLTPPGGRLPEHRFLLYEAIGPGWHDCHWCSAKVEWSTDRTAAGCLVADHVDGDTWNNEITNLVASCHTCNVRRARDRRFTSGQLFLLRKGIRHKAVSRVCQNAACGKSFLMVAAAVGPKNPGHYCSRSCHYEAKRSKSHG